MIRAYGVAILVLLITRESLPARCEAQPPRGGPRQGVLPPESGQSPPLRNADRPGPWDNDVVVYRIAAGRRPEQLATFERAGVPTVARLKNGRLIAAFQHFPQDDDRHFDRVAVRFSNDEGQTWSQSEPIVVADLPPGISRPFDPTLVPLPDGRIRVYFTSNRSPDFRRSIPEIYSAVSTDGIHYDFEPGVRFGLEGRIVIDCAAALHDGVFHLIVPDNGTPDEMRANEQRQQPPRGGIGYHALSRDGLKFDRVADLTLNGNDRWLGNMQSDKGRLVFFGTGGGTWPVTSVDGVKWEVDANAARIPGADPGAVKLKDGSWLVVVTSPPRPGTVSAQRRQTPPNPPPFDRPDRGPGAEVRVESLDSKYAVAPPPKAGSFGTGQDADLMLGGFGINNAGGPLLFNHPTGLATDGQRLLLTDRWNNRVLIWKTAPERNSPPDLVLGQPDFTQNNSGVGKHQLNWPGNVAITSSGIVAVTDTNNDRVLIWKTFPAHNGAPADLVLELGALAEERREPRGGPEVGGPQPRRGSGMRLGWPWGVWTDGQKFAVVATHGSAVLIWNGIPSRDNQPPDLILRPRAAGTPRNITSNGDFLAVSDHNNGERSRPGTMVWRSFPTSGAQEPDFTWGEWLKGTFTTDGRLIMASLRSIFVWDQLPRDNQTDADVVLRPEAYRNGDGPDAVVANDRLYVCNYNGNNVLAWNALPRDDHQPPDFSLGSDTPQQDTWAENHFITNPVVATDGKSLFVSSDFDRKLFVWRNLPDESAARPDWIYSLPEGPWDNAVHGQTLALAGRSTVYVWNKLPLQGELPDVVLRQRIGSVELGELTGVAIDDRYFYLSDRRSELIYVWEGVPNRYSEPKFTLALRSPGRLTSDGTYLAAAPFEGSAITLWRIADFGVRAEPITLGGRGQFNLPGECLVANGRLFVADRSFHRVQVWDRISDALDGRQPDAFLGAQDELDHQAAIGRNSLFMPGSLAFDGSRLWVGEFKFSTRILRFSPRPPQIEPADTREVDSSQRINRLTAEQRNALPDISQFANHGSDRFIVDLSDTSDAHPFRGADARNPHSGAHIYFDNTHRRWPKGAQQPVDYPPIYAAADGIITGVTDWFRLRTGADRYGVDLAFAKDMQGEPLKLCYSIEPFIPEPSPGFYRQFLKVSVGQKVLKGDVIGYMFIPAGQTNTHIHFHVMRMNGDGGFMAPAIFTPTVAAAFHERVRASSRGADAGTPVPACFGYKIRAAENPFGTGPRESL